MMPWRSVTVLENNRSVPNAVLIFRSGNYLKQVDPALASHGWEVFVAGERLRAEPDALLRDERGGRLIH